MSNYKRGYMYADDPDDNSNDGDWAVGCFGIVLFAIGIAILAVIFAIAYAALGPQDPEPTAPAPKHGKEVQLVYRRELAQADPADLVHEHEYYEQKSEPERDPVSHDISP
jgi:hypothetical protein